MVLPPAARKVGIPGTHGLLSPSQADGRYYRTSVVDGLLAAEVAAVNARQAAFPITSGDRINTYTHGVGVRTDTISGVAMSANQIRGALIYLPTEITVDTIGINVTTAVADSDIRLGIGAYDFATKVASAIVDCGEVASATTGDKTITIDQTLGPGWYVLLAFFSHAVSVQGGNPAVGYSYNTAGSLSCMPVQTGGSYGAFGTTETLNTNGTTALSTWLVVA